MIEDFQHVCITCRDLERSIRFYEGLGLKVIEPIRELEEDALAQAMQLPRGHIKVLHFSPTRSDQQLLHRLGAMVGPCVHRRALSCIESRRD